jgi:hypothetical protein
MGQHGQLSADLEARVRAIAARLREVYPKTDDEWIEGFALDWMPEREIATWEVMTLAYTSFTGERNLTLPAKEEVLNLALSRSLGRSDSEVQAKATAFLNEDDRREFLAHFSCAVRTLGLLDGCSGVISESRQDDHPGAEAASDVDTCSYEEEPVPYLPTLRDPVKGWTMALLVKPLPGEKVTMFNFPERMLLKLHDLAEKDWPDARRLVADNVPSLSMEAEWAESPYALAQLLMESPEMSMLMGEIDWTKGAIQPGAEDLGSLDLHEELRDQTLDDVLAAL